MSLIPLKEMNVEEALSFLLSFPNALEIPTQSVDSLAGDLCGINANLCHNFINSFSYKPFFENVAYNGEKSIPKIVKIIHLALLKNK